jgi:hypothetical protein
VEAQDYTIEGLVAAVADDAERLTAAGVPGKVGPGPVM